MTSVFFGIAAALFWSVHDLFARSLAPRIGPMRMGLWIMLLSAAMLMAIVWWRGTVPAIGMEGLLWGLLLGVAYACGGVGLYKAFSLGPISIVGPITSAYPVLILIWGLFEGLSPTLLQWFSIAAAVIGAIIIARWSGEDGGLNVVAPENLLPLAISCIICCVGYASAVVIGQHAAVMVGEIEAAWLSRGTAILLFVLLASLEPRREPIRRNIWLGLVTMGILDAAGLISVNASGHFPGKEFAAIGISTYGALAVIMAALILRENVTWPQWFGIGLITVGVAASALPQ